jgi:hypothetical protein
MIVYGGEDWSGIHGFVIDFHAGLPVEEAFSL